MTWVPDGFAPPAPPAAAEFALAPLGPEHTAADHAAWSSSIAHVRATPGFDPEQWDGDPWPVPMSLAENRSDLVRHRAEFDRGEAFAYTVLDPATGDVIGCVYVEPDPSGAAEARARSWVRADRAALDGPLHAAVDAWLRSEWPLRSVRWPGRVAPGPGAEAEVRPAGAAQPRPRRLGGGAQLVAFVGSRDLAAADAFYAGVLGLERTEATAFANVYDAGGTALRVTRVDAVAAAPYTVLGWSVPDIAAAVADLASAGVVFTRYGGLEQDEAGIWAAPSGARVAWFADPDGNTLSVTEHPGEQRVREAPH